MILKWPWDNSFGIAYKGSYKFITRAGYEDYDILFDLESDPNETVNIIKSHMYIADEMREYLNSLPLPQDVIETQKNRVKAIELLTAAEAEALPNGDEMWSNNPESAKLLPLLK